MENKGFIPEVQEQLEIERWKTMIEEQVVELDELVEMGFFAQNGRRSFEQFIQVDLDSLEGDNPWATLTAQQQRNFMVAAGKVFGVNLLNTPREAIIRKRTRRGVAGFPSEGKVQVTTIRTNREEWRIQKMEYENPEVGTRYDLVRVKQHV